MMRSTRIGQSLLCGVLCAAGLGSNEAQASRGFGEVQVVTTVPSPGSPEGIAVRGQRFYVAGPAKLGTIASGPSVIFGFDLHSGQLLNTYPVQGENLLAEHANSCIAFDASDRLYVVNSQIGVYRLDPATGLQESYSGPIPNLPACGLLQHAPCSPTLLDLPPLPNDIAFAPSGDAYVSDSMQATIWRIPAGGGAPQIWFQDARFASPYIGVNGIRVDPMRTRLYVSVTTDMLGGGYIYTLPLVAGPAASDLKVFHKFALGDAPDGFAFGASGKLYVTVALPNSSGVVVLWPDGSEQTRVVNELLSPTVPFDSPANVAFDGGGSLLLTNHAFLTNLPSHYTVLDVFVGDTASPLIEPSFP